MITLITLKNGKPFSEANAEVTSAASYPEFYSGEAERAYGDAISTANPTNWCFAIKQPVRVVACLIPWNFPAAIIARKARGAIAVGYTVVVKPDGGTPLTALAMAYLAEQYGFLKGVLNIIIIMFNLADVRKALCEDPVIRKVSFTGSTLVGKL